MIVTILVVTIPTMILEAAAASKISRYHQQSGECIYIQNMPTHRLMHILHIFAYFCIFLLHIEHIFLHIFFAYNLHIFAMLKFM